MDALPEGCSSEADLTVVLSHQEGTQSGLLSISIGADPAPAEGTFSDEMLLNGDTRLGSNPWIRTSDRAFGADDAWFVGDVDGYADSTLATPWLTAGSGEMAVNFALSYNTEGDTQQRWDGVVLEMRTATEPDLWFDIGSLSSVAYDGQLSTNNTAIARLAWSGAALNWREARVAFGTAYAGEQVQLRWRMICDTAVGAEGFWLDEISIENVMWENPPTCDEGVCATGYLPVRGMGYDPTHNGHGYELQQAGDQYFFYFYTYNDAGEPEWFLGLGSVEQGVFSVPEGELARYTYDTQSGQALVVPDADARVTLDFNIDAGDPVCVGNDLADAVQIARFDWSIDGQQGSWCTEMLRFEEAQPSLDFSGSWYAGAADDGWGMTVNTAGDTVLVVLYFYDAHGVGRWVIGHSSYQPRQSITISMTQIQGYCRTCTPMALGEQDAGTLTLRLSEPLTNAHSGNEATVDVEFLGPDGGQWQRELAPIRLISDPAR